MEPAQTTTKDRLLDAAEELFANHGVGTSSLRDITSAAGANIAAVSYHFGSKDGLVRAVVQRRAQSLSAERIRLLELAESAAGDRAPTVRGLLQAFVEPVFKMKQDFPHFPAVMGRILMENLMPVVDDVFRSIFYDGLLRFSEAIARAKPELDAEEIRWRLFFTVGVFQFLCNGEHVIRHLSHPEPFDLEMLTRRVVDFCEGGMNSPRSGSPDVREP